MKNVDLYRLKNGFQAIPNKQGIEFSYAVIKNLRLIDEEIKVIDEMFKPTDDYVKKFKPEVDKLVVKHSEKDDTGSPKLVKNQFDQLVYDIKPNNQKKLDEDVVKLEKKFPEIAKKRKQQLEEKEKFLQKENKIKLFKIDKKYLPSDITPMQLGAIFEMVK